MTQAWRNRLYLALPFLGVAALAVGSLPDDGPTFCPFALCTGTACPGCGMTRALSHLIRGDVGAAMAFHPLVPLLAAGIAGGWIWFVLRLTGRSGPMSQRALNVILIGSGVALVLTWVARLLTGTLPPV